MKVLDAEFVQGFMRMADDGWQQGWHERNGGNLSYRIKPEEVEAVKEELNPGEWQPIGTTVPKLAGEYFLVTGSGKYFRNGSIADHKNLSFIDQNALSNIAFKTEGMYKLTLNSLTGVITVVEYED